MRTLGRQTEVQQLIRRGCSAFEVEVTLSGGPGHADVVVWRRTSLSARGDAGGHRSKKRRRLDADAAAGDDGSDSEDSEGGAEALGPQRVHTAWRIDGVDVREVRVRELTASMGIHFDNLCQFLPQERVQEFTNLSAAELLASTEEAIGDGALLRQHEELKRLSATLRASRGELARTREELARVEREQADSAAEYERLQRRNGLRQQVRQLQQKVLWVEKGARAAALQRARGELDRRRAEAEAARRGLVAREEPHSAAGRAKDAAQAAVAESTRRARAQGQAVEAAVQEAAALEDRLKEQGDELSGLRSESERWRADLARCEQELRAARQQRSAPPAGLPPQTQARLQQLHGLLEEAEAAAAVLRSQLEQTQEEARRHDQEAERLEASAQRRPDRREALLRKLEGALPGSRELAAWLDAMRREGRFRRSVFGPVALEMGPVPDPQAAAYLEQALGVVNLTAVVTEDKQDNDMVDDWLKAKGRAHGGDGRGFGGRRQPFTHKILNVTGSDRALEYPDGPAGRYAQYGITHTLDQLFEAPPLVKLALVDNNSINRSYVGSMRTSSSAVMAQLLRDTAVRRIYCPNSITVARASAYDASHVGQSVEALRSARLLADGVAAEDNAGEGEAQRLREHRQAHAELQQQAQALAARLQDRTSEAAALRAERTGINEEKKRLESSGRERARREDGAARRLRRLREQGDPAARAGAVLAGLRASAEQLAAKVRSTAELIRRQHAHHAHLAAAGLAAAAASAALEPLGVGVQRARAAAADAEAAHEAARERVEAAAAALRQAEARAAEELGADGPDAALAAVWAAWPDGLQELSAALAGKQREVEQAQAALRADEAQVLADWQRREGEMADLRGRAAAAGAGLQAQEADVASKKAAWLPELRRHMAAINEGVQRHFAALGCAGEAALREGEAFEEYAAEIRVQYRPSEPLRPLHRAHHSGGERVVATMVYLMALQGVTRTPFRVVDEINQGMDSRNERQVFNLLVASSAAPTTPQCFLLTPKIIANLTYNDHVLVHNIHHLAAGALALPPRLLALLGCDGAAAAGGGRAARGEPAGEGRRSQRPEGGSCHELGALSWSAIKDTILFGRQGA